LKKERETVVPGETLAVGMKLLPGQGTHRVGEEIRSSILGLLDSKGSVVKVIPLKGAYIPKKGDKVIGQVVEIGFSVWNVDIDAPLDASLRISEASKSYIELGADLSRYFDIGDYIYAEVVSVGRDYFTKISTKDRIFKKLDTGLVISISPVKVPRVIGKKGSMVNLLKEETGCSIIVGQNGFIWIKGDKRKDELLAGKAIKFIEENAHLSGLTDAIKEKIGGWKK
jgi:exosome complex component RRP4